MRELTLRECEVLVLLAEGKTATQIGKALQIGHRTVHGYLESIYAKLGAVNAPNAVALGIALGYVPILACLRESVHRVSQTSSPQQDRSV